MLKEFVAEMESEPEKTEIGPLDFTFKNKLGKGIAVPVKAECSEGLYDDLDIT